MESKRVLTMQSQIKEACDGYVDTIGKVAERRELWRTETKSKLQDVLTLVKDSFKLSWVVQTLESIENYQTINIKFLATKSDIIEVEYSSGGKKIKNYVKDGGYLAYCQSYNGKINVIIGFPSIESITSEMDVKVIATVEPNDITEKLVSEHVIKFLNKMTGWEGKDGLPIGF